MEGRAAGKEPSALSGVRVLDLTTNHTAYAARLLADLGADVIRVEPPGGGAVRRLAPQQNLENGETFSAAQAFLDAGKRSVTLDPRNEADRAHFDRLAETCDLIVENRDPEESELWALDYRALCPVNPGLILVSISPFGLSGPYAGYKATDLTLLAAGGLLYLGGYHDTEPMAVGGEQAWLGAAIFAAVSALAALVERTETGRGQWVDVSGQECVAFALEDAIPEWYINRQVRRRNGDAAREAGTGVYPCADGYVSLVAGRLGTARAWAALVRWVADSEAPGGGALLEPGWEDFRYRQSAEGIARFAEIFGGFCASRSREELYREGQALGIAIAPVNTVADLLHDAQLEANGYFRERTDPRLGDKIVFPGPPYRLSRTPARIGAHAPAAGEHNAEILGERQEAFAETERGAVR